MVKGNATLSVRISPDVFNDLKKYTTETNRSATQANVVESLLRYFVKQDKEQQLAILRGSDSDKLALLGQASQLIEWGGHAHQHRFWPWAIETYNELYEVSESAPSLRRLALFKLGSAWMDLAMSLRHQALLEEGDQDWREQMNAAIESLKIAIAHHHLFIWDQDSSAPLHHPIVVYNEACAWTLIAKYTTEKESTYEELGTLREQAQKEEEEKLSQRKTLARSVETSLSESTEKMLDKAFDCLYKLETRYTGNSGGMPLAVTQWFFEYSERDEDLEFLREKASKRFEKWLLDRKSRMSLLDSFKALRTALPKVVGEEMRKLV